MAVRGHGHWPILRQRCLVDVDDPDRCFGIVGLRVELLIPIKCEKPQTFYRERIDDADDRCRAQQQDNKRQV